MARIYVLNPPKVAGVLEVVTTLHKQATNGDLIGIAAALMYRGGEFDVVTRGLASTHPLEALGVVHVLSAELADIANGKIPK